MSVIHITNENFQEEVLNSTKPVLLDFFATWCGPCQMLSPTIEELANERSDVKVCKIDVDEAKELARKFRVMSVPTLMVVKSGEVTYRNSGVLSKEEILELL